MGAIGGHLMGMIAPMAAIKDMIAPKGRSYMIAPMGRSYYSSESGPML